MYMNRIHALPARTTNTDLQNEKFSDASMFEPLGIGLNHFLINRHHDAGDDDENNIINEDEFLHEKRELKKKLAKFYQGAQSPYTIAFPALIRSRRWIHS